MAAPVGKTGLAGGSLSRVLAGLKRDVLGEHTCVVIFIECSPFQLQVLKLGQIFFGKNHTPPNTFRMSLLSGEEKGIPFQ